MIKTAALSFVLLMAPLLVEADGKLVLVGMVSRGYISVDHSSSVISSKEHGNSIRFYAWILALEALTYEFKGFL